MRENVCKSIVYFDVNVYIGLCGKKVHKNVFLCAFLGRLVDFMSHDIENDFGSI